MHSISRRALVGGIGTTVFGGFALATTLESTEASLSGELDVANKTKEVQNPVTSALLNVEGSFSWQSDTAPSRIIIRLKLTHTSTTEQLEATVLDSNLTPTGSREIDLSGSITSHSEIIAASLTPDAKGESVTETATAVLSIELETDGTTLAQTELTDEFQVTVKQTVGSATISIGATGDITVKTS